MTLAPLRTGIREAVRQPRLAVALWLVNFLLAGAAALPAFAVLGGSLSHSPEGDRLLEGFSVGLVGEMLRNDARLRVLGAFAAAAGLLALVANAFASGGVLDVLTTDDRRSFLHRFGRGTGHFAGRFLRVGIAAGVVLLVAGALVMAATKALSRSLEDAAWPPTNVAIALVRILLLVGIAVGALVALDIARIRVVREDSRRAVRLYWSSLRLVARHPLSTLGLWAGNSLLVLLVAAAYLVLRNLVPAVTWAGIVLMLAAQQLVMLTRAGLRVALFAGEIALLDRLSPRAKPPTERKGLPPFEGEAGLGSDIQIEEWRPETAGAASVERDIDMLAEVLHATVHGGAGVSFFVPFSLDEARAFWRENVLPAAHARTRRVVVARRGERIVGTVQLDLAMTPNQRHRGEVAKMLVHPEARRRGVARALMVALEGIARSEGRTLLTLDTVTGSSAEPLYRSLGYVTVGVIPGYARASLTPDLEATTIMYKVLQENPR